MASKVLKIALKVSQTVIFSNFPQFHESFYVNFKLLKRLIFGCRKKLRHDLESSEETEKKNNFFR